MHLRTILHPTTCMESSRPVLDHAIELAREQAAGLVILHAVDTVEAGEVTYGEAVSELQPQGHYRRLWDRLRRWVQGEQPSEEVEILVETHQQAKGHQLRCWIHLPGLSTGAELILAEGDPGPVIVQTVVERGCDLIVMGSPRQPRGWTRVLFRSVPEYVLANSPCSVLAIKTSSPKQPFELSSQILSSEATPDQPTARR